MTPYFQIYNLNTKNKNEIDAALLNNSKSTKETSSMIKIIQYIDKKEGKREKSNPR